MSDLCSDMAYGREEWRTSNSSCDGESCEFVINYLKLKKEIQKLKEENRKLRSQNRNLRNGLYKYE